MSKKVYILCGEASGDMHAANMVMHLKNMLNQPHIRAWGGDRLMQAGATVVKHIRELAFMGFVEVAANLPQILRNFRTCKNDILAFKPDVLILVDYPGFNLRMATWAKKQGIKVIYYISPQVWAWKESRTAILRKSVDKLLVILPFELDYFKQHGLQATFVGHPLLDEIRAYKEVPQKASATATDLVALLPGSRTSEISAMLPIMLQAAKTLPHRTFCIAVSPNVPVEYYHRFSLPPNVSLHTQGTYSLLLQARSAWVTSGTATLETALFGVPQVVCYKGNVISYLIARSLVKVPYISLVNLIRNRPVVAELIQNRLTATALISELQRIEHPQHRALVLEEYRLLHEQLGGTGASERAAREILRVLA